MSQDVQNHVWKHSRAKGTSLLVLLKVADSAQDDGRHAWAGPRLLAAAGRCTERGVRKVLHRLERDGEVAIDVNTDGRTIAYRGRTFTPPWFIDVLCFCEAQAYEQRQPLGRASKPFRVGRPTRGKQSEQRTDFRGRASQQKSEPRTDSAAEQSERTAPEIGTAGTGNRNNEAAHIRSVLPCSSSLLEEQGAPAPDGPEKAAAAPRLPHDGPDETRELPDDNIAVITKLAHTAIEQLGATSADLTEAVKSWCARYRIAYDSGAVRKAIESALWQRGHRVRSG